MKKITDWIVIIGLVVSVILIVCGQNIDTHDNSSYSYNRYTTSSDLPSVLSVSIPDFSMPEFPSHDFVFDYESSIEVDDYNEVTVYVSRYGKIHSIPYCSGMKYYTAMGFDEAVDRGYDFCQNCY